MAASLRKRAKILFQIIQNSYASNRFALRNNRCLYCTDSKDFSKSKGPDTSQTQEVNPDEIYGAHNFPAKWKYGPTGWPDGPDPEALFIDAGVHRILNMLRGLDANKLNKHQVSGKKLRSYIKFMSDEELEVAQVNFYRKAIWALQIPPIMKIMKDKDLFLVHNHEMSGFHKYKYAFVDISSGLHNKDRMVLVRETNGVLRKANYHERNRMLEVYYPTGKRFGTPAMLEEANLQMLMKRVTRIKTAVESGKQEIVVTDDLGFIKEKYIDPYKANFTEDWYPHVLDNAVVQYLPCEPEYLRVCRQVFDHLDKHRNYDVLYSSRHYGSMVFYFAYFKNIGGLLAHYLQNHRCYEASALVLLYHLMYPECASAIATSAKGEKERIKEFIELDTNGDIQEELRSCLEQCGNLVHEQYVCKKDAYEGLKNRTIGDTSGNDLYLLAKYGYLGKRENEIIQNVGLGRIKHVKRAEAIKDLKSKFFEKMKERRAAIGITRIRQKRSWSKARAEMR